MISAGEGMRTSDSSSCARVRAARRPRPSCSISGSITCQPIVRIGLSDAMGSWNTIAIPRPRIDCIWRSVRDPRSRSPKRTWPAVTRALSGSRRIRAIAVTLLPLPDSPTTPRVRPGRTSKLTPLTASKEPRRVSKETVRSLTERSGASSIRPLSELLFAPDILSDDVRIEDPFLIVGNERPEPIVDAAQFADRLGMKVDAQIDQGKRLRAEHEQRRRPLSFGLAAGLAARFHGAHQPLPKLLVLASRQRIRHRLDHRLRYDGVAHGDPLPAREMAAVSVARRPPEGRGVPVAVDDADRS